MGSRGTVWGRPGGRDPAFEIIKSDFSGFYRIFSGFFEIFGIHWDFLRFCEIFTRKIREILKNFLVCWAFFDFLRFFTTFGTFWDFTVFFEFSEVVWDVPGSLGFFWIF